MTSHSNVWKLPCGSIVRIGGLPYETLGEIAVRGASDPERFVTHYEARAIGCPGDVEAAASAPANVE